MEWKRRSIMNVSAGTPDTSNTWGKDMDARKDIDWKSILKTVAPTVATALGGPLAGTAVTLLSNALTGKADADLGDISRLVRSGDPEVLLKLKEAEGAFKVRMKELDVDIERVASDDRKSARQREVSIKDKAPATLAAVSFAGFFGVLALMIFVEVPASTKDPLLIMLGALGAIVTGITQYYFGSSSGSSRKNDMLQRMLG